MRKGKNRIVPKVCSRVIIKNEETLNNCWRSKPSRLHKKAAAMTAMGGRYFFTDGKLQKGYI
jgi:hypothetical protein